MNVEQLIEEYTAAFRAANKLSDPPDISYGGRLVHI